MRENFPRALSYVLEHEGGYVDHPLDPGGATNMGITHKTLAEWRGAPVTKEHVRNIQRAEVEAIYKAKYWDNVRADDLPNGLDYAVFDYAVNSGVSRAAKALQRAVEVKADGVIGPMTLRAVFACKYTIPLVIDEVCDRRMAFLQRLTTFSTFGKGWSRRVAETRAAAHAMNRGEVS